MSSDVFELIKNGESETVEFKENFDKEAIESAVAFANTKGGIILIGVSDRNKIVGIQTTNETIKDWANQISQSTEPRIIPEFEQEKIENKNIVIIKIKEFPLKPVSTRGRCFRRVGISNRIMTPQEISEMHLQSLGTSWDALPAQDKTIEDIDLKKLRNTLPKPMLPVGEKLRKVLERFLKNWK